MKVKPKNDDPLDAWRLDAKSPIPTWAARKCHRSDGWVVKTITGFTRARSGDVVLRMTNDDDVDLGVLHYTASEFDKQFDIVED